MREGGGGVVMGECSDIRGLGHSKEGRARSAGGNHKVDSIGVGVREKDLMECYANNIVRVHERALPLGFL